MSSHSSVSPETLITVKATYDGNTRRFKVALKEVGPNVFQGKLRELLVIPSTQAVKFERYSDSAASYVTLDPQNAAVYKQLFRAAKAKLKLRIKVTTIEAPIVQDEMVSERCSLLPPSYSTSAVSIIPCASHSAAPSSVVTAVDPAQLDDVVAKAVSSYCSSTEFTSQLRDTVREEVEKQQPEQLDLISLAKSTEPKPAVEDLMTPPQNGHLHFAYAIYCNACNDPIRSMHYHCQECDKGDYDLCESCVNKGIHCYDRAHWLSKRDIVAGKPVITQANSKGWNDSRICNCCIGRFEDDRCVFCKDCKDYDLCISCLRNGDHGHDPRHTFARAHNSIILTKKEEALLSPGRSTRHAALCDNCDGTIFGVRHKCIDCPDWDYCSSCVASAPNLHPGHRFVQVFDNETVAPFYKSVPLSGVMHTGVYCDGPVCAQYGHSASIRGARYKCAICPDTDFCASCEASPLNRHNSSHPLIKFKTPIRNVHVTATDNTGTVMGDYPEEVEPEKAVVVVTNTATQVQTIADVKPTEEFAAPVESEVVEKLSEAGEEAPEHAAEMEVAAVAEPLQATFYGDSISDGTELPVGQDFTQTWYMKNTGATMWPAGVTVKFAGGDYMFLRSAEHSLEATVTDSEVRPGENASFSVGLSATWPPNKPYISYWRLTAPDGTRFGDNIWCSINVVDAPVPVAEPEPEQDKQEEENEPEHEQEQEVPKEQDREEDQEAPKEQEQEVPKEQEQEVPKEQEHEEDQEAPGEQEHEEYQQSETYSSESVVDVDSVKAESVKDHKEEEEEIDAATEAMARSQASSQMVFPKLEVESTVSSLMQLPAPEEEEAEELFLPASPTASSHRTFALSEDGDVEEEVDICSIGDSDGFMTDEEYDVLCASDEEFEDCEHIA